MGNVQSTVVESHFAQRDDLGVQRLRADDRLGVGFVGVHVERVAADRAEDVVLLGRQEQTA